ncbi:GRAM domain-containing protein [Neobacillus sp. NPDC093127]|uniref:GRAM domain-containing protein n=1 Tax=Neobacillus sp. NPDC093127 TaxID=3364296 RepID=UPI00382B5A77
MSFTELNKETVLVNKVNANLFRGIEAVGGKLIITNQRLMFTSHSLNIQAGTTEIPTSEIASVRKRNTMGLCSKWHVRYLKERNGAQVCRLKEKYVN